MPHAKVAKDGKVTEERIARQVLDAAFKIHTALGPGLLESVYEVILAHELRKVGLGVDRQIPISIRYDGVTFDEGFNAVHGKQLLTQLRLANLRLGLLVNFGEEHLKNGIKRVVNGLPEDVRRLVSEIRTFATFAPFA